MDNLDQAVGSPLPPLKRGLEAVQIEHEGSPMVLLRDQEGLTDQTIAVSLGGFLVATLLNGRHTLNDVQTLYTKTTGTVLSPSEIQNLIGQLEKADLLETSSVQEKRAQVLKDFLAGTVRKPQFMGTNYPKDPLELAVHLGKYFQDSKGPRAELPSSPPVAHPPLGIISPHIDLQRGGPAYAWAYQALAQSPPPDVIVAFGVAHLSPASPWTFTKKSYETPYGPVTVDLSLHREFEKSLWYDPQTDEAVHRTEHSLEFQALWLKYIWRDKTPPWVPILCSTFTSFASDRPPSKIETINTALEKMGQILKKRQEQGQRILVLAGVDLAHVGPRFGDETEPTPEVRKKIEEEDKKSLELAWALEADSFYMSVVSDGNWRKVCGLSALYCSLRLIKAISGGQAQRGQLLAYDQADDPMGGVVSFTSAIFPS